MNGQKSFSTRLSLNILLITSFLFVTAILVAAITSHVLIAREATKSAEHLLDATIADIENTIQKVELSVENAAWIVEEKKDSKEYLYHITQKIVKENDNIIGSAIAFIPDYFKGQYYFSPYSYVNAETGGIESKQLGNTKYDYFCMDWYEIPFLTEKPCWSEPYFDEGGVNSLISTYSYPIRDADGNIYAIMTADIALNWISEELSSVKPYEHSNVTMVSRAGSYVTLGKDNRLVGETIWSTLFHDTDSDRNLDNVAKAVMSDKKGVMKYARGSKVSFAVFGPLSNGWKVSMTCDYNDVLSGTSKMHIVLILIGFYGLLILFLVSYFAIKKITKPLQVMSESAMSIAEGNFHTELPAIDTNDEIQRLRDSFDHMQHSLVNYIEDLKTTTAANERFESELGIARAIQMSMLPREFPNNEHVRLKAALRPAKEVGGDLYDFYFKDDCMYFLVGDVSGKGVPAALVMSITKQAFRLIGDSSLSVEEQVSKVNDSISRGNDTGMFVTLFFGKLNLLTGELDYCNAGHNPAIIVRPDGTPAYMTPKSNLALGVFDGFPYQMEHMVLKPGSRMVLYTDGITEAERADKEQFGEERLLEWNRNPERFNNADEACDNLLATIDAFVEGNEQNDDITIMTIKYNG